MPPQSSSQFPHLCLRIAYDGSEFSGFQLQGERPTVQRVLEEALETFFGTRIRVKFTSRTDAGVHAYDQCVFIFQGYALWQALSPPQKRRFHLSLAALTKSKISLMGLFKLRSDFSFEKHVLWKEYHYKILSSRVQDPLDSGKLWWLRELKNLKSIQSGLKSLRGLKDFSAMTRPSQMKARSPLKNMMKASLKVEAHSYILDAKILTFCFRANGFLYHQVRTMVGTLVDTSYGKRRSMVEIIASKDRRLAGYRAPSDALYLVKTSIKSGLLKRIF